jgi:membrane protease YdiL (CAAX protease family)
MLSAKPWKWDAVMRLGLSVLVCISAGSLALSAVQYSAGPGHGAWKFFSLLGGAAVALVVALVFLNKAWTLETVMPRLLAIMFCLWAALVLWGWAQRLAGTSPELPLAQTLISGLSFQGVALLLVHRFVRTHSTSWPEAFGLRNRWSQAVLFGVSLGCCFFPVGSQLQGLLGRLVNLEPVEQTPVKALHLASSEAQQMALGVVTILLAPLAEELLFRGILYPAIKRAGFPRLALWGTVLIFAGIHANLLAFVPLALLALALTLLYEKTDNLLAPITAHAVFNALNFVAFYFLTSDRRLVPLLILFSIFGLVCAASVATLKRPARPA